MNPIAIHACNPGPITGAGNWTWLIPGRVPTLVDAGTGDARHLHGLDAALGGARLEQVLVTHAHGDHAAGAPAIAARFGTARFLKKPWRERDGRWAVSWLPIEDGESIAAGDTTLTAVHTPGHSPDHLCFWHEATRSLFCGDLAIQGATVWIPPQLQGDMSAYLASLERVLALAPERMFPAHGSVIDNPQKLLRHYLKHRREREEQVLDALRRGDTTAGAIAARIYAGQSAAVLTLATESVTAHLIKLERERRVRCDSDAWHIIEP